ncbi:MAG: hypothetical protein AAGB34_05955 [Planctomycetota bacterium]
MNQFDDTYELEEVSPADVYNDPNRDTRSTVQAGYCYVCLYNLAGVPSTGLCPECGTPVEDSEPERQLVNATSGFVSSLLNGTKLIKAYVLVSILIVIIAVVIAFTLSASGQYNPQNPPTGFTILTNLSTLLAYAFFYGGWWFFSSREVETDENEPVSRMVVRVAVMVGAIATVLSIPSALLPNVVLLTLLSIPIGLAAFGAFLTVFFAGFLYAKSIAQRLPNPKLAARAITLMWLIPTLIVAPFLLAIAVIALSAMLQTSIFGLLALPLMICPILTVIFYYNFFNSVGKDLKRIKGGMVID